MCGKQFKSHKMLTQHNRDVHIEGDFPCTLCDKTFRTKKHLANHVFIKHKEKESMQCNSKSDDIQCTYETTSVSNLNKHKKRVHEKIAIPLNFACSSCDFKTASKFSLKRHNVSCKKSVELLPHEISCTQCRKTFSTQKALSRHTKVHSKDKPDISNTASCVVCQKTFAKSYNLKRHQQAAHGLTEKGNVVQNSLGMAVFTTEALVKEKVTKPIPAEALTVQCDQCNYKAKTNWHLKRHMRLKHLGIARTETRGRKMKVGTLSKRTLARRKANDPQNLDAREISYLSKEAPMSERNLEKIVKFQKRKFGVSFVGNFRRVLKGRKNRFPGHFKSVYKLFHDKKGKLIERYLSCTKDLEAQINKVIEARKVVDPLIIVGCDGGMGSFIVTFVVIDRNKNYKLQKHKPTGFTKLQLAAKVKDIPESTHNLKLIFDEIRINQVSRKFKMIGDLKIYNMLLGMQSSGSIHPCPWGLCYKVDHMGQKTNQKGSWIKGADRTLEGNAEEARAFAETTNNRELLQYFFNCEFEPVIAGQNSTRVLDVFTIPVLHSVLLGPFNTLWNTLFEHFPSEAEAFATYFGMKSADKGGDFNGKTVKDIIHDEEKLIHLEESLPPNASIFAECLRGIANVHNVVVSETLDPAFETIISDFVANWKILEEQFDIGCTLKIHIIRTHMLDAIKETGKTFHDETDEVVEMAHYRVYDFEKTHGYLVSVRKMQTEIAAVKQRLLLEHLNSVHLR